MNDGFKFDPDRSAAIRQLLIDTVSAAPAKKNRRRLQITVASALLVALTATGTAAVALGAGSLFGAPAPTVSVSPTPSPSPSAPPTPSPQPPAPVSLATHPITPHDITAAPTTPKWTLDLPGSDDACAGVTSHTVTDGYALVQVGPSVPPEDTPRDCDLSTNEVTLNLVDTATGEIVWTRDWSWDATGSKNLPVHTYILGTSGRVLVSAQQEGYGPREVLELATGESDGAFTPGDVAWDSQLQATTGDSGDVVLTDPAAPSKVERIDPRDASNPKWSTQFDGKSLQVQDVFNNIGYTSAMYIPTGQTSYVWGVLDLATGAYSPRTETIRYDFFSGYTIRPSNYDQTGTPLTLTGLDDDGNELWTRTEASGTTVTEVMNGSIKPGTWRERDLAAGNGQFVVGSSQSLALVDGLTGTTVWSADASGCSLEDTPYSSFAAKITPDGTTIIIDGHDPALAVCRFDAATGARLPDIGIPGPAWSLTGQADTYSLNYYTANGEPGAAYDITTGQQLWTVDLSEAEWLFLGGYLIEVQGKTLSSFD